VDQRTRDFQRYRTRLRGIAYRMLGSHADADDILQEAYLRWHRTEPQEIRSAEGWLVTTVTRLCIDRLREVRAQRESYVGPWLPEPLVDEASPPADAPAELASSLSLAFLAVLERLAPEERAAFLLHEIFEVDYPQIAQILGKSEVASRQTVSRARKRVRENKPRVQVSPEAHRTLLNGFMHAIFTQDQDALMRVLSDGATWTSDGGGKAKAARKVIRGRDRVARFALGVIGRNAKHLTAQLLNVNGEPGMLVRRGDQVICVISIRTDGERVLDVYSVLNPDKLRGLVSPRGSEK
jgi:RNA polymerase sigma-70 factor, ECF subfamily